MAIKNIIFDYGKVIINLDFDLTRAAFEREGVNNFNSLFTEFSQQPFFHLFDCGLISEEEFRLHLRTATGLELSDSKIDECWNAMLLDIPQSRMKFLDEMKKEYKTFMLSNTNSIHLDALSVYLKKLFLFLILLKNFPKLITVAAAECESPTKKYFSW